MSLSPHSIAEPAAATDEFPERAIDPPNPSSPTWRWSEFAVPLIAFHFAALTVLIPQLFSWTNVAVTVVGMFVFGQGINLGYHRMLAHRSLKVPKWLEYVYVILALCCMEESPAKWVATHRRHHTFSDEPDDPHSSRRGIWWSHLGWLLFRIPEVAGLNADRRWSRDILKDPFYALLERHWWLPPSFFVMQIVVFAAVGAAIGWGLGESSVEIACRAAGLVAWGVLLRTVLVWHVTWSVNSLTHAFGYRNYETNEKSRNNWLVALLASGEGWHNNHHHDPASASLQHRWWEFDPTYYHIRLLEILGLARSVVRPRHHRRPQ